MLERGRTKTLWTSLYIYIYCNDTLSCLFFLVFLDEEEHASRLMEDMKVSGGGAASMFGSTGGGGASIGVSGVSGAPDTASSAAVTAAGAAAGTAAAGVTAPGAPEAPGAPGASAGASSSNGGAGTFNLTQGSTGSLPLSPPLSPMYSSPKGVSPRTNILPSFAWGKTMLKHLKRRPLAGGMGEGGGGAGGLRSHDGVLRGAGGGGRGDGGGGGGWGGSGLLGAGIEGEGGFVYPAGLVQVCVWVCVGCLFGKRAWEKASGGSC